VRYQRRQVADDSDDDSADRWTLTPSTIHHHCPVDEKHWSSLIQELQELTHRHERRRWQIMAGVWVVEVVVVVVVVVAMAVITQPPPPLGTVLLLSTLAILLLLTPSLIHHHLLIKPLLSDFDIWKRHVIGVFDQCDVEVIKITTAEFLMTPERWPCRGRSMPVGVWVKVFLLGSGVWFERERMEVEVFWRRVKKEVRRYSLVVIDDDDDGRQRQRQQRQQAAEPVVDDEEEPAGSQDTLADHGDTTNQQQQYSAESHV
jgi:hypothetical protein